MEIKKEKGEKFANSLEFIMGAAVRQRGSAAFVFFEFYVFWERQGEE